MMQMKIRSVKIAFFQIDRIKLQDLVQWNGYKNNIFYIYQSIAIIFYLKVYIFNQIIYNTARVKTLRTVYFIENIEKENKAFW